jgi:hypothetical protein
MGGACSTHKDEKYVKIVVGMPERDQSKDLAVV